jgi:phosphoenolpyruvate carboxylase
VEEFSNKMELSQQVDLLASLLGEAVTQNADLNTLNLVERLRAMCKQAEKTHDIEPLQNVAAILADLPQNDIEWLLRIYSLFFNLVNQAEIQQMIHINHERELAATQNAPRKESIAAAIHAMHALGKSLDEVLAYIKQLDVVFTLTAHPTEARRQTVLQKQRDIGSTLNKLNQPQSLAQQAALLDELRQYILLLLYTDSVRSNNLTVADEVRNGLYFLRTTIWDTLPSVYQDIQFALKTYYNHEEDNLPMLIHYHSWIGGDCDGNPFINPEVVAQTLQCHEKAALKTCRQALTVLRTELSVSENKIKLDSALRKSLQADSKLMSVEGKFSRHFDHEPYRRKITYMLNKLEAKLAVIKGEATGKQVRIAKQYAAQDFIADLQLISTSLKKVGLPYLAQISSLKNLLIQAKTFGFHMAALDLRQHSAVHQAALTELLRKKKIIDNYASLTEANKIIELHKVLSANRNLVIKNLRLSPATKEVLQLFKLMAAAPKGSIGTYVISMTHQLSDVLEVLVFAKLAGLWSCKDGKVSSELDVVPLFETVDDLERINALLTSMFTDKLYKKQLKARINQQELMLGYSDSNKDGGYWAANNLLYNAQQNIAEVTARYKVGFRIFHGRGGSAGRGGGRVYETILAQPACSHNGRVRYTEQGEVITFHYGQAAMAHRHYEQTLYAMLMASAKPVRAADKAELVLLNDLAKYSLHTYRELIAHDEFWAWYISITPIEFISKLPIASRPVSRKAASEVVFDGLRAIPWVFSWTQTRYNVPGWFGIGHALQSLLNAAPERLAELQQCYQTWPFFKLIMDNTQQELAKAHFMISEFYQQFSDVTSIPLLLHADYMLAKQHVLSITQQKGLLDNQPILKKSILLRNPYTDVLNLLQVETMRRFHDAKGDKQKSAIHRAALLSVSGLSAAMQSTG